MLAVNEQTSATLSLSFTDEQGRPVTPSSGKYRIDDIRSGTVITDWTNFTPSASSYDIFITSNENEVIDQTNDGEVRRVTAIMYYSIGKQCIAEYRYEVMNMREVPLGLYLVGTGGGVGSGTATIG
jgi:hypothetical protein